MSAVTSVMPPQLPEPERERWTVLRAGIQNVWEYDDRRFVFSRGRLLLRGQNEAGKTKAMELLFPFLLDADLSPQRLDPFGTVSRPMRWNLINEADPEAQLRIGYLWLELGRVAGGRPEYCTIGAGVKARRASSDVDAWFFVTSQRPDRDVRFLDDSGRPRARGDLQEAIGSAGRVYDRHGDYRRAVNERFFDLAEEQYAALVDTLLALRRPQLSKGLDLDQLSGFLSASLPPLDARVVGPIAEGFERLDHHRADLESLRETLGKLRGFEAVYRGYARAIAKGRAQDVARAESAYQRARGEARDRAAERDALVARRAELEAALRDLDREEAAGSERIRALEGSDAYRAARDLDEAEGEAARSAERAAAAGRRRDGDARGARAAEDERASAARDLAERERDVGPVRAAAAQAAEAAALASAHGAVDALAAGGEPAAILAALAALSERRDEAIGRIRALHRDLARAEEAHRRAEDRARDRASELSTASDALAAAEREADGAVERWCAAVDAWRRTLEVLPADALPEIDGDAPDPAAFRSAAWSRSEAIRRALAEERARAAARVAELRADEARLAADREALARAAHPTPPAPAWRPARPADRPGAPLYLVCGFGRGAAGSEASIEAALESSGLLDAWVEPDGTILDPRTEDAILRGAPAPGRTLADVLVPAGADGIDAAAALAALRSIGFAAAGEEGEGPSWVAADGRWRLGAVRGAWTKSSPAYVGAAARERERARRIAEIDAQLGALADEAAAAEGRVREADERDASLAREMASLPSGVEVERARTNAAVRAEARVEAQARCDEAEGAAAVAAEAQHRAAGALDAEAAERGVAAFARDPERLAEVSRSYFRAADGLVSAVREAARAREAVERALRAAAETEERAAGSRAEAERADVEAAEARARADALRDASGRARDEVLAALGEAREAFERLRQERRDVAEEKSAVDERVGVARTSADAAEQSVAGAEETRKGAAGSLRSLAETALLAAAGFPTEEPPEAWSFTTALELARRVDAEVEEGASAEERNAAEDRLMRRQADLALQLPAGVRIIPSRAGDVLSYQFTWNGRTRAAPEVLAEIATDVAARAALLGEEESRLLEQFLSGEAHDHLASRLRQARALVDRMNAALEQRTTAAGAQVRLAWRIDDAGAQAEAAAAVPLFFRASELLTDANRSALRAFLEQRLAVARDAESERSLQERLLDVLDYRKWHRFQVEHRAPNQAWAPLTRKAHAAGSGGKKAVMLHLPLFAAAAAFYDSAARTAPRVIALDEAFAGIDRPTRGKLMGLLAEFDLDFVMTSFEEWGFYEELDGISTYHLSREPGVRGVFAEWFVWNGRERVLVEES